MLLIVHDLRLSFSIVIIQGLYVPLFKINDRVTFKTLKKVLKNVVCWLYEYVVEKSFNLNNDNLNSVILRDSLVSFLDVNNLAQMVTF